MHVYEFLSANFLRCEMTFSTSNERKIWRETPFTQWISTSAPHYEHVWESLSVCVCVLSCLSKNKSMPELLKEERNGGRLKKKREERERERERAVSVTKERERPCHLSHGWQFLNMKGKDQLGQLNVLCSVHHEIFSKLFSCVSRSEWGNG